MYSQKRSYHVSKVSLIILIRRAREMSTRKCEEQNKVTKQSCALIKHVAVTGQMKVTRVILYFVHSYLRVPLTRS